ncbi:MAG: exonuclease [Oscillospiraceae bacterium]|nr:exonuclease [Oscillospiraceae bacterium]
MDFVAIDFETATSLPTSICSMGICIVEDSMVTDVKEILIKPVPYEFYDYNILIHGITPLAVRDKPTFAECYDDIFPYIDGKTVIAHNASFDIGALRSCIEKFNLKCPVFRYMCTVQLSQKAYPELPSHKLNNLCDEFGINFSHHHANDDAYACACILLKTEKDFDIHTFEELSEHFSVKLNDMSPEKHKRLIEEKKAREIKKIMQRKSRERKSKTE